MKIHIISDDSFAAELSENDMKYYCLDCETLDIENTQTRELISDLIISSRLKFKTAEPLQKLNIDVIAQKNGSALILVSLIKTKRFKVNQRCKKSNEIIAFTKSIDDVLKMCEALSVLDEKPVLNLYYDGENYAVEVGSHKIDKKHLNTICLEFCENTVCDSFICSQIKEHYKLLCKNFIPKLSS